MIERLAAHAIVMLTRLVSRGRDVGSGLTRIGHRCALAACNAVCLGVSGYITNVRRHATQYNPAKAPSADAARRTGVLAVDARKAAHPGVDPHGVTAISRPLTGGDGAATAAHVMAATAALRGVLREERAHVEAGEMRAVIDLRERKFAALAAWRSLVAQLPATECTAALGHEAVEIEAYARKTFDLVAEALVARSPRRGVC